jgi:hypothetical protein
VEPRCPQRTWSETNEAIRPRAVLSERARAECARRVGQDATDVARVAADLGVGWGTVMRAVWEYGQKILNSQWLHTNVDVLGLDETAFLAATAVSPTRFVTGLVDLQPAGGGPARLLDIVFGRSGRVVSDWLEDRGPDWCARVQVAALDPFRGYATALRAGLPAATVVLDSFHAVRLAQDAVDRVRRRVQQQTLGHRGLKADPRYRIRRVLLRGAENLTPNAYRRLLAGLDAGDPHGKVGAAYIACQDLRHLYSAQDLAEARRCRPSTGPAPGQLSPSSSGSPAPSAPENSKSWRTSLPAACRTARPKRSTCSSSGSSASASDSATSTTTGSGSSCTAVSPGTLAPRHGSEAGHHVLRRRAGLVGQFSDYTPGPKRLTFSRELTRCVTWT